MNKRIVLLIVVAVVGTGVLVAVLLFLGIRGMKARTPTEAEKRLLVSAAVLEDFGVDVEIDKAGETYKASKNLDGTLTIEYEYDSDKAPNAPEVLYVQSEAEINPTTRSAASSYKLQLAAVKAGVRIGGGKLRDAQHLAPKADESYAGFIESDGNVGGNVFVVRQGRVVHSLLLAGIYFEDAADVAKLMEPVLAESRQSWR